MVFDDRLFDYIRSVSLRQPEVLARLREETRRDFPRAGMMLTPEQGQLLALLVKLTGACRIVEVGTFTGYSALWMALALPEDGRLTCCDVDEPSAAVARRYWAEAGVAAKIDLRLGPALDTLDGLIAGGLAGRLDMVFIDADKANYANYYEKALVLLRRGGLAAVDNVLWGGEVADPAIVDDETVMRLREFNARLHADERIDLGLIPAGDGLTLAVKR